MYKTSQITTTAPIDGKLLSMIAFYTFDSNYATNIYQQVGMGVIELALILLSWVPFSNHYTYKNYQNTLTRDNYGCDQYGWNTLGNVCTFAPYGFLVPPN